MIKILIADDHPVVRQGIRQIIAKQHDMAVEGEAQNAQEVLSLTRKKNFDIVVLDLTMPDRNGLEVLAQLKRDLPKLPVLILSIHSEEQYATRAIKAGAAGYLNKNSMPEELIQAIRKIVTDGKYVSSSVAERLIFDLKTDGRPIHETLSDREFLIMCMIASGKTVSEIAGELFVSIPTVSTQRARILKKMKMKTNAELTYYAIKNKLVD